MALFQTSVLKSHLALLNQEAVDKAYKKHQKYFWNTTIQENIKSAKEEQYQATFLNELFVNILGYTLFPNPNSNLTTEFKNEKNARKADGAILKDGSAIGVIELKGTNTKDLESIRRQAFDYKANQKGCIYVITSNFEKLRFYINDATEFEEFDLFTLSPERFKLLYLCLHQSKVLNNIPLNIKEASIAEEEEITKAFYKDYSVFKRELFRDLVRNNSKTVKAKLSTNIDEDEQLAIARLEKNVKLTLFKKSQKLIDRFLFIFFAEDRMLLPSNSTLQILKKWKNDQDFGDDRPLYDLFKQYFNFLDTGRKGTQNRAEIYAYNGGLFKPDAILDAVEIDSDLLFKYTLSLSNYDFESQVDVNILGHIFENSLNEIESVSSEIEGGEFDKQTSKRKKDGVFYTPKYITKYIVENTIGKLCEEKKIELSFHEEEYFKGRKNRNKTTIANLVNILDEYRDWLLQLTICDPACGSGAFLNQALDFLIKEHSYIDELKNKILGGGLQFSDIENTILENNIYGVDLNEESVEIAKLSLWLRTAQPRRKLNDLSSNVKCGNSLIDDRKVAGDKAFKWETEFPHVFKKGGFDVVIGNPPYVRVQNLRYDEIDFYKEKYEVAHKRIDVSLMFFELGFQIIKQNGLLSFITSIQFVNAEYGRKIRELLLNYRINEFIDFDGLGVFDGATTYPGILMLQKQKPSDFDYFKIHEIGATSLFEKHNQDSLFSLKRTISHSSLNDDVWVFGSKDYQNVLDKLEENSIKLKSFANPCTGLTSGKDKVFIFDKSQVDALDLEKEILLPVVRGRNISRFYISDETDFVLYPYRLINGETKMIPEDDLALNYPKSYAYLKEHRIELGKRKDSRKLLSETGDWYKLIRKGRLELFRSQKILTPGISKENRFAIDHDGFTYLCGGAGVFGLVQEKFNIYYLTAILNSKAVEFFLHSISTKKQGGYYSYLNSFLEQIPIPIKQNIDILSASENIERLIKKSVDINEKLKKYMSEKFNISNFSTKLQSWHELSFGDFIKELIKAIKANNKLRAAEDLAPVPELTKKDEFEWMELFEENKKKAQDLQSQIAKTEKEIDQMVYQLYGLNEEEIKIVENS
ncbi:hypothetical protein KCTC52924_03520 [Arenibacter antarcticus]|uniref:site-specific DNA-methyltransferase (adenine-specific) n=1 Tax=Arenibacter antarcticus TaxID=2040469 RepID=A0ABW5VF98_9FLAO|nr:DNA methyltransferase [Arenibacter sp. H213]MCM4166580.1 restriction endonuclease subunit M [Arenibacter sp. H213]